MSKEMRKLEVGGRELSYELRRNGRAKRMNIRVVPGPDDGRVVLTLPKRGSVREGERFLARHADWAAKEAERLREAGGLLARPDEREYRARRAEASVFIREKAKHWSRVYGLRYAGITIRNQTSRWGSCSSTGRLSFNWKLLLLPERFADYVVVHELCHLVEFNHSRRFWALVERGIPEYREIVRELRKA